MPPCHPNHTFVDEEMKIEAYEKMRCQKEGGKNKSNCPGIRILCRQGMFVWMAMSWTDLIVADHEDEVKMTGAGTGCVSEMVSMMASLIFQ